MVRRFGGELKSTGRAYMLRSQDGDQEKATRLPSGARAQEETGIVADAWIFQISAVHDEAAISGDHEGGAR